MGDEQDLPTTRMTPLARPISRQRTMLERTRDGFVLTVGTRTIELTRNEALDLSLELMRAHR